MNYQLSEFGVSFFEDKLSNGVGVFLFNKKGSPIYIRTIFFAGSRFDSIPGTAHFLEHMLVAGTKKFSSKDKLAEPLERVGGSFSASTGHNYIKLNITVPKKEHLNIGFEILEEILSYPLFDNKTVENERGSIISEIGKAEGDPHVILDDVYYPLVFNKTSLENNVLGDKDSVNKITKEDLLKFKENFLHTGRMGLLVSGDITMGECLPLLNKLFQNYKIGPRFVMPEKALIHRENHIDCKPFKDNKHTYTKIGFRTLGLNENNRELLALDLISGILGKGRASRLLKKLRYENGLVYVIGASHSNYPDAGHLSIFTSFDSDKLDDVTRIIFGELEKIEKNGMSNDEFEFIKSATTNSVFNIMQTSQAWINVHESEMTFNPKLHRTVNYFMNEVNSLTLEEVNTTAKKYLRKDNFYLALCGTEKKPSVSW